MDQALEIKRISKKLDKLLGESTPKWLTAKWVQMVTGWDKNDLQQAREQNVLDWRLVGSKIEYDINSIPKPLLKWTTEITTASSMTRTNNIDKSGSN